MNVGHCTCNFDVDIDDYEPCDYCWDKFEARECACCGAPMGYFTGTLCPTCRRHEVAS